MSPSFPVARKWRLGLVCSLSSLLLPAEGSAQAPPPTRLDPIEVAPSVTAKPKPAARSRDMAAAARPRPRPATAAPAGNMPRAAASGASGSASPTLNATTQGGTGSRLNLTPLQTPASVEIITARTIAERGQHDVLDAVTQDAAGFTATPAPGNGGLSFSTRGFAGSNSVMTLYDGTRFYIGSGTLTFPYDTWSTQRIEVLRGPASVLYGEGAIGGVINVIPKKPQSTPHSEAEVSLDSNMTRRLSVDSTGPINPNVSYRVNATGNMSDGWVDRDKTSNAVVSAAVRVQASDNLAFTLSQDYGDRSPSRYFGTSLINGSIQDALRFKNYNALDSAIRYQDSWTQFRTEWDVADGIKVNNTLYYLTSERHWRDIENYTWNPKTQLIDRASYIEIFHDQKQLGNRMDTTFSGHVFGLANQFVAGFDVNRIDFAHTNNSPYGGASPVNPYVFDPGSFFATTTATTPGFNAIVNQYALFAEDRLSLTDQLSLVTGVRYDRPEVDRTDYKTPANSFETTLSGTSWRAGLVYEPIKNLAFYGQYAVGVDPVSNLISLPVSQKTFQLATGKQTEIGVKRSFWGGRGEWTLAAYEIVKTGLTIPDPGNPTGGLALQIGQQSSRGVEGSIGLALSDGWRVDANLALLRARYDNNSQVVGGRIVSYNGNVPVNVPQQVANVWLTWDFAPDWSVYGGVQIVGAMYSDLANTQLRPGYNVVNGGIRWKPDDRTTVAFRLYNLFDKVYAVTSNGTGQWLLGMPRTAELSVNVKF
ncbi:MULTISPECIES: TonB-dependent receptor [Bradyrhizobium]|jgi:iron complex outermembrane recepter protein|uniref:Iron complex outermembrane receptor protein n=1 Tax=Bradyrhizobium elkanii TaxID=29448 RepID=A0A8I2C4R2_BRAEL|nr:MULTISPECIES: TonB-dependent receptor [Bradyrhizobium]MBP1293332.1 iron complex outermembrane receptor protein [Bradyrhizobium elkanii]MCP1926085.1 iron complex outermembrane receptor protein [Bradyrhizobium elkanii]MCS3476423.1 iron complex outermembrane receptor protein [Bradyrhizobium elkanii]MCS3583161.1 iron complex outermembrane receptor protein [Bradyrhizobium elkanii]MCS3716729.1 iron complex outermembrane receptor protein [Bradyrhizobium elkanii]